MVRADMQYSIPTGQSVHSTGKLREESSALGGLGEWQVRTDAADWRIGSSAVAGGVPIVF